MKTQSSLFPDRVPDSHFDYDEEVCEDDWETPTTESAKVASLLLPSDKKILEPCAGTGQVAVQLQQAVFDPYSVLFVAVEIKPSRVQIGKSQAPFFDWRQANFLSWNTDHKFHVVVTNPPFSTGCEFIARSLSLLDRDYDQARLLFLLPSDYFQATGVNRVFRSMDAHIHRQYQIVGRVAYLQNGVPKTGRMRNDSVFDIRPGKHQGGVIFL